MGGLQEVQSFHVSVGKDSRGLFFEDQFFEKFIGFIQNVEAADERRQTAAFHLFAIGVLAAGDARMADHHKSVRGRGIGNSAMSEVE